jgi:ribonuclease HI
VSHGLSYLDPSEGIGLYTDGSSSNKDKSGGWAWLAIDAFDGEYSRSGGVSNTTNGKMELTAWIKGLEEIFKVFGPSTIIVFSDAEYVGLGAMDRTRNRNVNLDLWDALDKVIDQHLYVEFRHVKGHAGNTYNEEVDRLAGKARIAWRDRVR